MCKVPSVTKDSPGIAIEVSAESEDLEIEGNASAVDPVTDKIRERSIKRHLAAGNAWAWCTAHVKVTYRGVLSADAYLGACSYNSEKDFRHDNGYFGALVDECISKINSTLAVLCGPEPTREGANDNAD